MLVQADLKRITLQLELPDDLPVVLQGDAARLTQILTNLLCNAIKFTDCGGVILCVRSLCRAPAANTLSFTIRDTGIGIDAVAQARLFAPFIQADESITRRYGGTGLGLSIVDSLTKLMGGTVDFTSTVGVGSEFRVVLEFALATGASLASMQPAPVSGGDRPLSGVRVLVVDDYDLNLMVTRRILEQSGARVWAANNGQEACEKLQLQPAHFDVVLMDVQMPIMDGYEATRRIRGDLGLLNLPIIAVTAGALVSERQRATAAGMDGFIIKPFEAATLVSSVLQYSDHAHAPANKSPSASKSAIDAEAWPEIAGIDSKVARNRLCDDPALFRTLLLRFIGDFAEITPPSASSLPAVLVEQASLLHKLSGGACMLGAMAIQQLATEAEAACMAGDAGRAGTWSSELVTHLDALRLNAAWAFEGRRNDEVPRPVFCEVQPESRAAPQDEGVDATSERPRRAKSAGRWRVLLVDDDDILRADVAKLLERSGYLVGEAASGKEALRALRGGDYRIVITDFRMPGMSGLEFCRELRVRPAHRDLYVIMLTMSDRPQEAESCLAAGADAFILKTAPNAEIVAGVTTARQVAELRSSARELECV
jgi:CheY-like chemotaxis protein